MADNTTSSMPDVAQKSTRQGTGSPTPAQQDTSNATTAPSANAAIHTPASEAVTDATPAEEEQGLPELDDEAYDTELDSALGSEHSSGGTSITSRIIEGHWSGGRRYQATKDTAWSMPSDDKQFESMHAGHLAYAAVDSMRQNPFFRAPIRKDAQHILDLGTGSGGWALDVADMFPNATVNGVDLYPPPQNWVPPNCILEVDDFTKPWTWNYKFDLVHLRLLLGALPRSEWKKVYRQAYDKLQPGGWIEHTEVDIEVRSLPAKPLPEDATLRTYKSTLLAATENAGHASDNTDWMRQEIEDAGFVNVHELDFKMPVGDWPSHPVWKEAGKLSAILYKQGLQGWVTWGLSKFGAPSPWSPAEIDAWVAKLRNEIDQGYHVYNMNKRVWAQKPYDTASKTEGEQHVVENDAPAAA